MNTKQLTIYQRILPWIMLTVAVGFYFYEFILQVSPGVMTKQLKSAFMIKDSALGLLASVYFYSYSGMQIPLGIVLDKFGARKLLTLAALSCVVGVFFFAGTHIFIFAILGRILIGLGSAAAYIGCAYIAANWLPINRFAMINGFIIGLAMLGAMAGQTPIALLVKYLDWQKAMLILGAIGILIALLFWIFLKDKPKQKHTKTAPPEKLLVNIKQIIRMPQNWLTAIYAGLMFTSILIIGTLWGVPFISAKYDLTTPSSSGIIALMYLGFSLGAPIIGWLSDRFQRRNIFMITCCIATIICLTPLLYLPETTKVIPIICLFAFGFFSSSLELGFSIIREINPQKMVGTALGYMNFMNMIGAAIAMPVVGIILDMLKTASPHLSLTIHYEIALTSLLIIQLAALILVLFVRETYAKLQFDN